MIRKAVILILLSSALGCVPEKDRAKAEGGTEIVKLEPKRFPFDSTRSLTILSYENRRTWTDVKASEIIADDSIGVLNIKQMDLSRRIKDSVTIEGENLEKLYEILYSQECPGKGIISFCYDPRHLIIFNNQNGVQIAAMEICIACSNGIATDATILPVFCEERFNNIAQFFSSVGVKYFGEYYPPH